MSTMRINHNISAINAHRNMIRNDHALGKTLEHLSSGMKINRAGDGPAALVISEQFRAQIAGLRQAVANTETTVSMIQTAEGALNEVNGLLTSMRQLAIHAANEGVNDDVMLEADQSELVNSLNSIDRIANNTQFGTKYILNGSNGSSGAAIGKGLRFIDATVESQPSGEGGYAVNITRAATQSQRVGTVALSREIIDKGEVLTLIENGQSISYSTRDGDTFEMIRNNLQGQVDKVGMNLSVNFTDDGKLVVTHNDYGSKVNFEVISSTQDILSKFGSIPESIQNGRDVEGTIDGKTARGDGIHLTGAAGTNVEGLKISYTGAGMRPEGEEFPTYSPEWNDINPNGEEGRVVLKQNSLKFQIGGNYGQTVQISLKNVSGFESLREIDLRSFDGSTDAIKLVDDAINQISSTRADLGAFQKNTLETNLNSLRVSKENMINSESVIRDSDMAEEMADFTKNQIMLKSSNAMLAQANQTSQNVLQLLRT